MTRRPPVDYVTGTASPQPATDGVNGAATCDVAEHSLSALAHVSTEQLNERYRHAVDAGRSPVPAFPRHLRAHGHPEGVS